MDIEEYRERVLQDVSIAAQVQISDEGTQFVKYAAEMLMDAQEFEDFTECYYEGTGTNRRLIQIDGFTVEDIDGSCVVFISDYRGNGNDVTLTKAEIDNLYRKMEAFVIHSINGYLRKNIEESTECYEFARLIEDKFLEVRKFRFYILTDAYLSNRVKNIKKDSIDGKPVDLNVWDINRLYTLANSNTGKESIEISFDKYNYDGIPCVKAVNYSDIMADVKLETEGSGEDNYRISYDSYLAVIPGNILNELYLEYDARLLEGNVRAFLGFKKINSTIRNTITNYPEMFFAYNNGIAATATEIDVKSTADGLKITTIKDLQIINGGQTTASIANALLANKDIDISRLSVPMKISVLNSDYAEKIIPRISECANTQNKIDAADFFSNHPFHIRMEEYSRKTLAPAVNGNQFPTFWFYERARGQYDQGRFKLKKASKAYKEYEQKYPKSQIIKKVELAKYMNLYEGRPDIVSKGAQANMVFFAGKVKEIWDKNNNGVNVNYYKRAVAMAILFRCTDEIIKKSDWYKNTKSYKANVIAYSMAVLFDFIRSKHKKFTLDFQRIWNMQGLYPELEKQMVSLTYEVYKFITREDRTTLNVTEWCKKSLCWERAQKESWTIYPAFESTLVSEGILRESDEEAKNERNVENEIDIIKSIMNEGQEYWQKVIDWGNQRKLIYPTDLSLLKMARDIIITGKLPNDKQAKKIIIIRDRLIMEGMPKYI